MLLIGALALVIVILDGLPWKQTEIILSFLRLHPSTAFQTLLLTMIARVWNEGGQRLIEFCQENTLVVANIAFQQHKRRLYTWTSPNGQHRNQIDYILCSQRWRSSIKSAKTRPKADCGSDHELLIAKFRLKLKKVGKTTRPFRHDINQIPYDYSV